MSALIKHLDRVVYPSAPAERLALFRLLVGAFSFVFLLVRFGAFTAVTRWGAHQFAPLGPVQLLDGPLPPALAFTLVCAALPLSAAFALGYRYTLTGPLFALLFLWVSSYRSSWGMNFHTENLLCLHLLALALAPAADALSLDARAGRRAPRPPSGDYGWALRCASLLTIGAYFLAGLAKLKLQGLGWAEGEVLRVHIAYDNLRKLELGSLHSPLGAWLVGVPAVFPLLGASTLLFELGGLAALFNRRLALYWCCGIWLFHAGVVLLMAIAFPYPLALVPFASFFEIERGRLGQLAQRWFLPRAVPTSLSTDPGPMASDRR